MICQPQQSKSLVCSGLSKEVELDFGWRDLDAKMEESGEYRQVLEEISAEQSKHDAKLRSDALDRSLMQQWYDELEKENKERIAQENANKQHIQNKPENTVQKNTVQNKQAPEKKYQTIMTHQVLVFSLSKQ